MPVVEKGGYHGFIHVLRSEELANLLDKALEEGRITEEQREQVLEADVVLRGRWRQDDREVYLVAEVSLGIGVGDVTRARERASFLSQIHPALPAARVSISPAMLHKPPKSGASGVFSTAKLYRRVIRSSSATPVAHQPVTHPPV